MGDSRCAESINTNPHSVNRMNSPGDSDVRQQALDISRSYIVKAPAGSGKTTLLVKRYLHHLTAVNHPEEVIAITFTRKAAGELVSRVMSVIKICLWMPCWSKWSTCFYQQQDISRQLDTDGIA